MGRSHVAQSSRPGPYRRGAELAAWPVFLAILVTAVNDHLLKASFPGSVTGKISDFSGLFFFPFFLTAIVGRIDWLPITALLTGLGFLVLKFTGFSLGPFRITPDRTDLVALLSLVAAVAYGKWRWRW